MLEKRLKQFLKKEGLKNIDNEQFNFGEEEVVILEDLLVLSEDYGKEFAYINDYNMDSFKVDMLPEILADAVKLTIANAPSFSNIASLSIATFVLADMFGQLRCRIDDVVYSENTLGVNFYSIVLSSSGSGKDRAYNALLNAFNSGFEHIKRLKLDEAEKKAKDKFISQQKDNKDFNKDTVTKEDYASLIKPLEDTTVSLQSSRGGITTSLNRMSHSEFGTKSIFASELAQALSTSSFIGEVFELISTLYDIGASVSPEYKTEESKERPITDTYVNFLGISSAANFYTDNAIKVKMLPMLSTAFARRLFFISPNSKEDFENLIIAKTAAEDRKLNEDNAVKAMHYRLKIDDKIGDAVKFISKNKTLTLNDEAGILYKAYKSYTQKKSSIIALCLPGSVLGIEQSGRAFRLLRVAALWAMAQGKNVIDVDTLNASIYFGEYTARHFQRFNDIISMRPHELLAHDFNTNKIGKVLPLHKALTGGYIQQTTKTSISTFIELLNSHMKGQTVVSYSEKESAFIFTNVIKNTSSGDYCFSASPVTTDRNIEFKTIKDNATISQLSALTKIDSIFNPFTKAEATKWVCLAIVDSEVPADILTVFMQDLYHIIAYNENILSYTVLLPINAVISKAEYNYVVSSIATNFMLVTDKSDANSVYNGYSSSTILSNTMNPLATYDVSDIRANYMSKKSKPSLPKFEEVSATQLKKRIAQLPDEEEQMVSYINGSENQLLAFSKVVRSLRVDGLIDITNIITSINSLLDDPLSENELDKYIFRN